MNELVKRLSKGSHPVQANRPDKSGKALKERIDLNYVHILFKETGTEIGIRLDRSKCDFSNANFEKEDGLVHVEGALTLNYDKVRCIADINLSSMEGSARLEAIDDVAYSKIVN